MSASASSSASRCPASGDAGGEVGAAHRVGGRDGDGETRAQQRLGRQHGDHAAGRRATVACSSSGAPARSRRSGTSLADLLAGQRARHRARVRRRFAGDLEQDVAGQHAGLLGRAARGEAHHHQTRVAPRRRLQPGGDADRLQPKPEPALRDPAAGEQLRHDPLDVAVGITRTRRRGPKVDMPSSAPAASSTGPPSSRPERARSRWISRSIRPFAMLCQAGPTRWTAPSRTVAAPSAAPKASGERAERGLGGGGAGGAGEFEAEHGDVGAGIAAGDAGGGLGAAGQEDGDVRPCRACPARR